jgi:hypothetical protein
MALLDIWGGSK